MRAHHVRQRLLLVLLLLLLLLVVVLLWLVVHRRGRLPCPALPCTHLNTGAPAANSPTNTADPSNEPTNNIVAHTYYSHHRRPTD